MRPLGLRMPARVIAAWATASLMIWVTSWAVSRWASVSGTPLASVSLLLMIGSESNGLVCGRAGFGTPVVGSTAPTLLVMRSRPGTLAKTALVGSGWPSRVVAVGRPWLGAANRLLPPLINSANVWSGLPLRRGLAVNGSRKPPTKICVARMPGRGRAPRRRPARPIRRNPVLPAAEDFLFRVRLAAVRPGGEDVLEVGDRGGVAQVPRDSDAADRDAVDVERDAARVAAERPLAVARMTSLPCRLANSTP